MRSLTTLLFGIVLLASHTNLFAQTKPAPKPAAKPAPIAPAAPLKDGWEEIDKRLVFLMVRLANVEASLDAVEKSLGLGTRQQAARVGDAKRAEQGNEMMDRKGGGPVKWSQFYGRTAEKFFYHPTDRNTTYHTTTILSQQSPSEDNSPGAGVPSRQGLPVHQRPPQFDYIYKANRDAQARAEKEASQLRGKVDGLQNRRRQLEDEQVTLWCQIAFRVVSRYDLPRKPLYRFEPTTVGTDPTSQQQAEAVKAAAIYMRSALSIIEIADRDQAKAFGSVKVVVADAYGNFDDGLLALDSLVEDITDTESAIGRYSALARRLRDVADNISDSYEVSIDGDRFKDELRKDTFRGLLQESLVDYAEVVLAMNEMGQVLEKEWKTKPNTKSPLKFVSLELPARVISPTVPEASADDTSVPANEPAQQTDDWISLFDGKSLAGWKPETGSTPRGWSARDGELILSSGKGTTPKLISSEKFDDFEFRCEFWLDVKTASGIYLRGRYELQLLDDPNYPEVRQVGRCASIWGQIAPSESVYRGPKEWNDLFVRLENKNVTVVLNGTTVIDNQHITEPTIGAFDTREDQSGPMMLQSQGTAARFRNMEIRPL